MGFMVYLSEVDPIKESRTPDVGLCATCRHRQENRSDRGTVFLFCRKSEADSRFPKYPSLPVAVCSGHEPSPR
jgi:hypothetical protein